VGQPSSGWDGPTPNSKMNQNPEQGKRARKLILRLAVAGTMLLCTIVFLHGIHRVDPKRVDAAIAQGVPFGAGQEAVLHFLDAQHIAHSGYYPEIRRIYAGIDKSSIGLMKGHINIEFNFGADGKLVSYKVQELFDFL
jgi:hypothetical protein